MRERRVGVIGIVYGKNGTMDKFPGQGKPGIDKFLCEIFFQNRYSIDEFEVQQKFV
jgi:hypothetical protein